MGFADFFKLMDIASSFSVAPVDMHDSEGTKDVFAGFIQFQCTPSFFYVVSILSFKTSFGSLCVEKFCWYICYNHLVRLSSTSHEAFVISSHGLLTLLALKYLMPWRHLELGYLHFMLEVSCAGRFCSQLFLYPCLAVSQIACHSWRILVGCGQIFCLRHIL